MYGKIYIIEYYLYNMDKLIKNPVNVRKNISLNINIAILDLVRDLTKLTKTDNTFVIESLLVNGVSPLFKQFKNVWTAMSIEAKDEKKKKHLKYLLNELQEISNRKEVRALIEA